MQLLKQIGSVLLLTIYSLGMVHGAIPHSHYAEMADALVFEHSIEHGQHHDTNDAGNHTHLAHAGHFDNGFMNMLISILSEADYTDISELFVSGKALNKGPFDAAKLQLAAVLISFITIDFEETAPKTAVRSSEFDFSYQHSHTSSASRRGPPAVS